VPLHGAFLDFDRLRRGFCTTGQAKTVFTILHIDLDTKETEALLNLFMDQHGNFHYSDFVRSMNQVSAESDYRATPPPSPWARLTPPYLEKTTLISREEAELQEAEMQLAKRMRQLSLSLKGMFQDFDRTRNGRVTQTQFMRIMDSLQFGLSPGQAEKIFEAYSDPDDPLRFLYPEFCQSVSDRTGTSAYMLQEGNVPFSARTGHPPKYFNQSGEIMPHSPSPDSALRRPFTR